MFRPRIDLYIVLLLTTVAVASVLPARGIVAGDCKLATTLAIGLLFFLYGARLTAVHDRRPDRDRFLRLEEIAGQRIALGQRVVASGDSRVDGRAVDDVPQMQSMVCAWLARRYAARPDPATSQQISAANSRARTALAISAPWSCC